MKGSSLIEWLRWNALQPKVTRKNSTQKPPKSTAQNLTFKIPPHQINPLRKSFIKSCSFWRLQVSWKMKNSPGNRTWKLWCLQILKMKIHHLELQNNKNAQWQMKSKYVSSHMRWKSHSVFFACSVFYLAFVHKKNLRRKSTKRTGGATWNHLVRIRAIFPKHRDKKQHFHFCHLSPLKRHGVVDPRYQLVHPLPFRSSPVGV